MTGELPRLDELEVHYQPIVELASGRPVAVEALVRWRHPLAGVVPPCVFLGDIDRAGLLGALDEHVLRRALDDLARIRWLLDLPDLRMTVNLSACDRGMTRLLGVLEDQLAARDLDGSVLTVDLAAPTLGHPGAAIAVTRLRALSVGVAADNIGAAGLVLPSELLDQLNVDQLKIDRTVVGEMCAPPAGRSSVGAALVQLARRLGADIVAEGVETAAQRAVLCELGVALAQGYLYCRPAPIDRLTRFQWDELDLATFDPRHPAGRAQEPPAPSKPTGTAASAA
jgi:EAL domain-containing protein (putative c-di-GMP-specific phosphodiesterase class I)